MHIDGHIILECVVIAFKLRQRQQVIQQMLHAPGVVQHQVEIALGFCSRQVRRIRQSFDKTTHHRQWRAQLV